MENNAHIDICLTGKCWVMNITTATGDTQIEILDKEAEWLQRIGISVYTPEN